MKWLYRLEAFIESWGPIGISVFAAIGTVIYAHCKDWSGANVPDCKDLSSSTLNLASIAVGFLMTAKAILLTVDKTRAAMSQKQAGTWPTLISFMSRAIGGGLLFALVSALVPLFAREGRSATCVVASLGAWAGAGLYTVLSLLRVSSVFSTMLLDNAEDDSTNGGNSKKDAKDQ